MLYKHRRHLARRCILAWHTSRLEAAQAHSSVVCNLNEAKCSSYKQHCSTPSHRRICDVYINGTRRMPLLVAELAPRARVPASSYVPPPLRHGGWGWWPEFNKTWAFLGMPGEPKACLPRIGMLLPYSWHHEHIAGGCALACTARALSPHATILVAAPFTGYSW